MNKNLIIGLDCLLERRLLAVQTLVHDTRNDPPLEIGLVFEDDFFGTFHCNQDGSLGFSGESISPLLMGEYGDYKVEEIFHDGIFAPLKGACLTKVYLIESQRTEAIVGAQFMFAKASLAILVVDGRIEAFSKIPQSIRNEGKFKLVALR